ncbi:MAG: Asp-tRNA(Asn)/Glu-tRNA(Gln) amidotransferase subunit GatB [Candidatus Dependentiae bacterium]|nr:Asp-tRNA(Asn)/Glu-tRNA(Gln) amidotransferase subunit GatB [Candidatus Dependentiae bacterium]
MAKTASVLDRYPEYEVNIGMEVHTQLTTKTKIFCTCANEVVKDPNTNICQICAGHPGVLPVLNKQVLDYAILAGLATNSTIASVCQFARKHYFYPDLPKGYQTTQSDQPICSEGYITIRLEDGTDKKIRVTRIHMEEDAGKNIHASSSESFVDLNRAGTPLLETVSYPDLSSAQEVKSYLKAWRSTVLYLDICSGNMEDGAFRADTNISVRKKGAAQLGTKVELKNINSFKFIGDAIEHEIERQIELLENGGRVRQETRLWDSKAKETVLMRSKEEAADYRYFQDPDLPLIAIDSAWIDRMKQTMPELPAQKFERLVKDRGLTTYEADIIVDDLALANYYEKAAEKSSSKQIVHWILRDVIGYLNEYKLTLNEFKVTPEKLAEIIELVEQGKINNTAAKEVFALVAQTGANPSHIVKEKGLEQIGSSEELEKIVKEIIDTNPQVVTDYKSGKERLFGFFVGQAMAKTQGKGNPKILQELIKKYLQ